MAFTIVKKFISKKWTKILLNRIALEASRSGEINVHISYDNKKVYWATEVRCKLQFLRKKYVYL